MIKKKMGTMQQSIADFNEFVTTNVDTAKWMIIMKKMKRLLSMQRTIIKNKQ